MWRPFLLGSYKFRNNKSNHKYPDTHLWATFTLQLFLAWKKNENDTVWEITKEKRIKKKERKNEKEKDNNKQTTKKKPERKKKKKPNKMNP